MFLRFLSQVNILVAELATLLETPLHVIAMSLETSNREVVKTNTSHGDTFPFNIINVLFSDEIPSSVRAPLKQCSTLSSTSKRRKIYENQK